MFTPDRIFLNALILIVAGLYWYMTGHAVPAVLGGFFVLVYMYDEKLYLFADILAIITLILVIYFFISDYYFNDLSEDVMHFGSGILYMIVIYLKAKRIFNAD